MLVLLLLQLLTFIGPTGKTPALRSEEFSFFFKGQILQYQYFFSESAPLGLFSQKVAMSICLSGCLSVCVSG